VVISVAVLSGGRARRAEERYNSGEPK